MKSTYQPNAQFDLSFSRVIDVPKELVWRVWTEPELLKPWFCPLPWKTIDCEIDLRPGGIFRTTMQSPEGKEFPGTGCYLEVNPNKKTGLDQRPVAGLQAKFRDRDLRYG